MLFRCLLLSQSCQCQKIGYVKNYCYCFELKELNSQYTSKRDTWHNTRARGYAIWLKRLHILLFYFLETGKEYYWLLGAYYRRFLFYYHLCLTRESKSIYGFRDKLTRDRIKRQHTVLVQCALLHVRFTISRLVVQGYVFFCLATKRLKRGFSFMQEVLIVRTFRIGSSHV